MTSLKDTYLFVYGTLRHTAVKSLSLDDRVKMVCEGDAISGKLYDLGWYPGVRETGDYTGDDVIIGDTFELLDESIISDLDLYEGYPVLYGKDYVVTKDGHPAMVYVYNGDCSSESRVHSGDWLTHLNNERCRIDVI